MGSVPNEPEAAKTAHGHAEAALLTFDMHGNAVNGPLVGIVNTQFPNMPRAIWPGLLPENSG